MARSWEEQLAGIRSRALEVPDRDTDLEEANEWFRKRRAEVHERIGGYYVGLVSGTGDPAAMQRILTDLVALSGERDQMDREWQAERKQRQKEANIARDLAIKASDADRKQRQRELNPSGVVPRKVAKNKTPRGELSGRQLWQAVKSQARAAEEKESKAAKKAEKVLRCEEQAKAIARKQERAAEREILDRVLRSPAGSGPPRMETFAGYCPVTRKQQWPTKRQAQEVANRMNSGRHRKRDGQEVHAYSCSDCNHWHVGRDRTKSRTGAKL